MNFLPKDIENIINDYKIQMETYEAELHYLEQNILIEKIKAEKIIKKNIKKKKKKQRKKIALYLTSPLWIPPLLVTFPYWAPFYIHR
jgi:hypothetical protein